MSNRVSTARIAQECGVSLPTVTRAIRRGDIDAVRNGARRFLVDLDSARAYFERPASIPADPIDAAAQKIADSWPELTDDQKARLSMLLRPAVGGAA